MDLLKIPVPGNTNRYIVDDYAVTIDKEGAIEIDDALSCRKLPNGNYLLGVHIASPLGYFPYESKFMKEALSRNKSIYLPSKYQTTEDDFQKTLDIVNYCQYDGAYTFIFSPRVGTAAAKMKDDTPMAEKENRLQRLNELVNKYSLKNNKKLLNKTVPVLILDHSEKDSKKLYGYTDTMKLVNVTGDDSLIGKIVDVVITDAKSFSLDGETKKVEQ